MWTVQVSVYPSAPTFKPQMAKTFSAFVFVEFEVITFGCEITFISVESVVLVDLLVGQSKSKNIYLLEFYFEEL